MTWHLNLIEEAEYVTEGPERLQGSQVKENRTTQISNLIKQHFSEVRRCFSGRNLRFFYPKHGVTVIEGCVSEVSSLHFIRREIDE